MKIKLVLASKNKGKIRELQTMIKSEKLDFEIFSLHDFPEIPEIVENGHDFKENALIKAIAVQKKTGLLALADDSGLEVDFLNGAPGIYSARFAGEPKNDLKNNKKLLQELENVPFEKRSARFKCVIAIVTPEGKKYFSEGTCEGLIATEEKGQGGFGYDPLFYLPQYDKTMAELDAGEKNLISHRAKAFKKALNILRSLQEKN